MMIQVIEHRRSVMETETGAYPRRYKEVYAYTHEIAKIGPNN